MTNAAPIDNSRRRAVKVWLLAVAGLVFLTLIVGGATRLTESGLSIVEWKPVTGVIPPVSDSAWQAEFEKYRAIPQYQQVNRGMSLSQFKTIYWWEWTHRLLGRLLGVAFGLPFIFFLWRGWIEPHIRARLWFIFALGAVQGGVGWWMVSSGLADRVSVSQYRLAFHMTLACVIYAALLWTAQQVMPRPSVQSLPRVRNGALLVTVLVLGQIYLGALVAGLDAGMNFNTWPLIDGAFIPSGERLWFETPWWRNLFENMLTVQFNHRMMAYALFALAWLHAVSTLKSDADKRARFGAVHLAGAITIQAMLGIVTLLNVSPLGLSLAHQAVAILVLTSAVIHAERLRHRVERRPLEAMAA